MTIQVKKLFVITLLLFISQSGFSIIEYNLNDTLYVWAGNGLNLRTAPSVHSPIIAKVQFGDKVFCKAQKSEVDYWMSMGMIADYIRVNTQKVNVLDLKGDWVKVTFKDRVGYVFDAYLSKLTPVSLPENKQNLLDFFAAKTELVYHERKDTLDEFGEDEIFFDNGIYMKQCYYPSGFSYRMMIPKFSVEEAFLLIRYLDQQVTGILRNMNDDIIINQKFSQYQIKQIGNMTVISWGDYEDDNFQSQIQDLDSLLTLR